MRSMRFKGVGGRPRLPLESGVGSRDSNAAAARQGVATREPLAPFQPKTAADGWSFSWRRTLPGRNWSASWWILVSAQRGHNYIERRGQAELISVSLAGFAKKARILICSSVQFSVKVWSLSVRH